MKIKLFTLGLLVASLAIFSSCGSDEEEKVLEIILNGEKYSLEGANIFYDDYGQGDYDNNEASSEDSHKYRDFVITDGDGGPNYTYYLFIEFAVPISNDFASGQYPDHYDWNVDPTSNISYFTFDSDDYYASSLSADNPHDPFTVKGGLDVGDMISVSFDGSIYLSDNNTESVIENATMQLFVNGEIAHYPSVARIEKPLGRKSRKL